MNLFGASQRALPPGSEPGLEIPAPDLQGHEGPRPPPGFDAYVARLERVLVEQYRRGGLTAKAKDAIDEAIDGLQQRDGRPPG
jgi:hypothetical protein